MIVDYVMKQIREVKLEVFDLFAGVWVWGLDYTPCHDACVSNETTIEDSHL